MIAFWAFFWLMFLALSLCAEDVGFWPPGQKSSDYSSSPIWTYGGDLPVGHIEVADLNGDNLKDIIAAEYNPDNYSDSALVYALDGFTGDTLWTFWFDDGVRVLISGDINLDNVPDIIGGAALGIDIAVDGHVRAIDGATGDEIWSFATGGSITDLAIGNFNNSGNLDVAVVGYDDYVYAVDGSTGDDIWSRYLTSVYINAVAVGDVNEDGIDDVGYAHEKLTGFDNYMGVLNGVDGSVIWEQINTYFGTDLLIDDIDDDGLLEAVFGLHFDDDHGEIQVRNALTGGLEWSYDFGPMNSTYGEFYLNSIDIDDDKDKDLIVGNYAAQKKLYIFDGDNNIPAVVSPEVPSYIYQTAAGDVDNDGFLDIIAASSDRVQIFNSATGNLMWYFGVNGNINDVACADFDGDLWTDIAAGGGANFSPSPLQTVWALKTIQTPLLWQYNFGRYGNALTVVDLDQDGHDDVVTVASLDDRATAIDGKTGNSILWSWTGTENLYAVTHGDFDNDGDQDIAVAGYDQTVTALDGLSGEVLWQFTTPTAQIYRSCLVSTDLNGDGADDVIAGSDDSFVYAINGLNGMELWNYPPGDALEEVALGQMNGTGPLDVVCGLTNSITGSRVVVLDGSDGSWLWQYNCNYRVEYVEVFDVNGDEVPDVAAGVTYTDPTLYMLDGATHTPLWTIPVDINPNNYGLAHGDVNGDKDPDVIVAGTSATNKVFVYDGPTGALLWDFTIGAPVLCVLGYDVNGDGDKEVIAGGDDDKIYVIDGDGTEMFSYYCAERVKHIQVGDISGNGDPNIACVTFGSSGIAYAFKSLVPEPNVPPYTPTSPDPEDGAIGISVTASLSWAGGDPNANDQVHYDVYFGTDEPLPLVSDDQLVPSYDPPGDLEYGTEYLWQIIAFDEAEESTAGPIWSFKTEYAVMCGDCNDDLSVNVSDAVFIINYVFIGGTAPDPLCVGDTNADGSVNVSDAVAIINYVFVGGDAPDPNCCGK